jgi:hypothetical protein
MAFVARISPVIPLAAVPIPSDCTCVVPDATIVAVDKDAAVAAASDEVVLTVSVVTPNVAMFIAPATYKLPPMPTPPVTIKAPEAELVLAVLFVTAKLAAVKFVPAVVLRTQAVLVLL